MSNNKFRSNGDPGSSGSGGGGWAVMAPPPRRPVTAAHVVASSSNQNINIHLNNDCNNMPFPMDHRSSQNSLPHPQLHQQQKLYQNPRGPPTSVQQRINEEHRQHRHSNNNNNNRNNLKRQHSPSSNHRHNSHHHHHHHRHDPSSHHQRNNSANGHHQHDSNKRHRSGDANQASRPCAPPVRCSHSSNNNTMLVAHHVAAANSCPPPPQAPHATASVKMEQSNLAAVNRHSVATMSSPRIKKEEHKKEEQVATAASAAIAIVDLLSGSDDDANNMKPPASVLVNNNINNNNNLKAIHSSNNNNDELTHILFVLDFSSSMLKKDVKTNKKGHQFISRWDAVFECIRTFLAEQLATLNSSNNNNNDIDGNGVIDVDKVYINSNNATMMIVSVVIFNDKAETLLERMPLVADGKKVLAALDTARKMHKPKGGTGFSAGFERARALASNNTKNSNTIIGNSNVVLVFLSDGRPGDLQNEPPSDDNKPMQTTFRCMKQTYPAAGVHIEAMQRAHGGRFSLQLVCLCSEGNSWLRYLADRYNGTFHEPDLALDNDAAPAAATGQKQAVATMNNHNAVKNGDDDDDVLDIVVKSQNTVLREKFNRAVVAGNVHTVASTTMAASQTTSSMRSTFQSISSTVTAMRNGSSSRLQERQVVLANESPMISYRATRMVLDADHGSILLAPGEQSNGRLVSVSMKPFAQGGLRNVYRMQQSGERRQVAKESRHDIKYQERLKFHIESAKCMAKAKLYAQAFNSHVKQKQQANKANCLFAAVPPIAFLSAEVYRLKDSKYPGGFRYLAVEPEMNGEYEKWNSNNGFVNNSECTQCLVAQAFSHFSYESSKQEELVVDIQGSGNEFTDPQLHSKKKQFGRADRGASGFQDFFRTHKCNYICHELGLKNRSIMSTLATTTTSHAS